MLFGIGRADRIGEFTKEISPVLLGVMKTDRIRKVSSVSRFPGRFGVEEADRIGEFTKEEGLPMDRIDESERLLDIEFDRADEEDVGVVPEFKSFEIGSEIGARSLDGFRNREAFVETPGEYLREAEANIRRVE